MPVVQVSSGKTITAVRMENRDSIQCICLELDNKEHKFLNFQVFLDRKESYRACFAKYESLVSKRVNLYCWDPINHPGKWSEDGWFKNIKLDTDLPEAAKNIEVKGFCHICNVADGLLNYTDNSGETWSHYKCSFPNKF